MPLENTVLVLAGPAGSGKSRVAEILAPLLGWSFLEGDVCHLESNRQKMSAGTPLTEDERWPWFDNIRAAVESSPKPLIVTTSVLKPSYRTYLCCGWPDPRLVFLVASKEALASRLAARKGHFFPAALLDSQLALQEPPAPALCVDANGPPESVADLILRTLQQDGFHYSGQ